MAVVDCHYHYEPRLLSDDQLLSRMDECGVDKVALMGVVNEPIQKNNELLTRIFRFTWSHNSFRFLAKLLSNNFTPEGDFKLPTEVLPIHQDPKNRPVFEAVTRNPDRFLGWVFVNPRGPKDQVQELNKWKDNKGFVGVKAHPFWHRYPPIDLLPVAVRLAKKGKPLLIHAGFGPHGDFEALLREVPNLKLLLAHAGFPLYSKTWKSIRNNRNACVDLSQSIYLDGRMTREAVENLGAERCLFGTDGPYGVNGSDGLFDYSYIKTRIEGLFPDKGIQARVLGENFLEFIEG